VTIIGCFGPICPNCSLVQSAKVSAQLAEEERCGYGKLIEKGAICKTLSAELERYKFRGGLPRFSVPCSYTVPVQVETSKKVNLLYHPRTLETPENTGKKKGIPRRF